MSLTLHFHPLSSFCQKVLIGLYELDVPFEKHVVDLADPAARAALCQLWPLGKFPVLRDEARGVTVPEASIILEYLDQHYARAARLSPTDPDGARDCRLRERFYDLYVNGAMQKIVTDKLRPEGHHDAHGVARARADLATVYAMADEQVREGRWALGEDFSIADCAAAPSLFFAEKVVPFDDAHPRLAAYFKRLTERPSVARAFAEARPYLTQFPG